MPGGVPFVVQATANPPYGDTNDKYLSAPTHCSNSDAFDSCDLPGYVSASLACSEDPSISCMTRGYCYEEWEAFNRENEWKDTWEEVFVESDWTERGVNHGIQ